MWSFRVTCSLRSMAVLSSRAQERPPRAFSALARLYYLVRPTKTAMLRRLRHLWNPESIKSSLWNPDSRGVGIWNTAQGMQNPLRGIQNPRLSWIPLHGPNFSFRKHLFQANEIT